MTPVRTALVGYGYWGVNLARNIALAASLDLVAVADADEARRAAAVRALPGIRTWATFEEVLADDDVEAVVLATPALMHEEMAVAVLESGRHVMVEKPLAMTPEGADRVVAWAEVAGRTAMVGHTFLYSPPVRELKGYIDRGDLGRVQYLYSQRLSLGKIRRDCNALWNFAPHDVSIILYLLGERPVTATATSLTYIQDGVADVFFATLKFPSGVGANVHVSWLDPRKTRLMTVVGDEKMAVYDDVSADQKIALFDAGVARSGSFGEYESMGEFQWKTRSGDILIPKITMTEPLLAEMEEFGRSCASGEPGLTDATHGRDVVKILYAIDRSAASGGTPVELAW
ncbi:MAG TPA: Gfo/Idh/MocA family oxidoreductase [Acidimicrobiales bacterium]|jgi:predicted dehydrogenase|nr:Gfo/Idh/MocA family oxidoreductase [Acidimicrobiales bacterium]